MLMRTPLALSVSALLLLGSACQPADEPAADRSARAGEAAVPADTVPADTESANATKASGEDASTEAGAAAAPSNGAGSHETTPVPTGAAGAQPESEEPTPAKLPDEAAQQPEKPAQQPDKPAQQPDKSEPVKGQPSGSSSEEKPASDAPAPDDGSVGVLAPEEVPDADTDVLAPASADPEDIRAMRSAQQMIAAESRLKKLITAGELEGVDQLLTFEEISSWPYIDGLEGMPKEVKELDGKKVMMVGFMLPIDEVENIKEFLLVQSLWACCYGQPPDINGIVRVVMTGDNRCDYHYDPIKMVGKFKVEAYMEDGYCVDIYQLHVDKIEPLN